MPSVSATPSTPRGICRTSRAQSYDEPGWPESPDDGAAEGAELRHEPCRQRVTQRIVLADGDGRAPAERVVRVRAEPCRELPQIRRDAEDVRAQRRAGREAGRDKGELRLTRLVQPHGQVVQNGRRRQEDVDALLLGQAARRDEGLHVRAEEVAAEQKLDSLARDPDASDPVRGSRPVRLRAAVDERQLGPEEQLFALRPERPPAVAEDADADRPARGAPAARRNECGERERRQREQAPRGVSSHRLPPRRSLRRQ
jgi:hypothetical protein